jgi:hypothetical protein
LLLFSFSKASTHHAFFLTILHKLQTQQRQRSRNIVLPPILINSSHYKSTHLIMAAAAPQQNFIPQVRDPADGKVNHTYIPRADGSILIGGVAYIPQANPAAPVAAVPVIAAVPAPVVPVVTPPPVLFPYPIMFPYFY